MQVSGERFAIRFLKENDLPAYLNAGNRKNKYKQNAIENGDKINLELVAYDIQYAYAEHLNAKKSGDIDLSVDDFANIPYYVATYDDFLYAIKYKSGTTKICVSKKVDDGIILIIETVSKSHGSIEFKNLIGVSEEKYVTDYEKKYKKSSTSSGGNVSSNNSPRNASAFDNSIS